MKKTKSKQATREFYKEYFEAFAGITKGKGNTIEELMKEKKIEQEL